MKKQCSECPRVEKLTRGYCSLHYQRWKKYGDPNKVLQLATGETVGGVRSPEYKAYLTAKGRCNNPNNSSYKYYGEIGIKFKFRSVHELLKDVGRRPSKKHSLDRIKTEGHYEPGNVRWATPEMQNRNRGISIKIKLNGEVKTLSEWCEIFGTSVVRASKRYHAYKFCGPCSVSLGFRGSCGHRGRKYRGYK